MRSGVEVKANIAAMTSLVQDAASAGATYVQTPEMTGLLQKNRKALFAAVKSDADDLTFKAASKLAKELSIWLHICSTPILRADGKVANRAALFSPDGKRTATYDKIHMFDVDLDNGESWRESAIYAAGEAAFVTNVNDIKLGFGICYDVRFPDLFHQQALAGANVLTAPAAFTRQTGQAHWHVLMRARAIENGAYMVAAAQGGTHEDSRETYGHSLIVNPWGEIIAEIAGDELDYAIAEVDIEQSKQARAKIPNLQNGGNFILQTTDGPS